MTDPGWDVPGVPRESSAGADAPASSAAASPPRRGKTGRKPRTGSVSASSGMSAGAFAPLRDASDSSPARAQSSPGTGAASLSSPAAAWPGTASTGTATGSAASPATASPAAFAAGTDAAPDGVQVTDPAQALALLSATLDFLAHADPAEWPEGVQADCLRALAVAESQQAAVHAAVLRAFSVPGGGLAGDGHFLASSPSASFAPSRPAGPVSRRG
jgi:hypothetical protein